MKLIELHPDWLHVNDPRKIIDEIGHEALFNMIEPTAEHYNKNLPLWRVLNHYEVDEVGPSDEQAYVPCKLLAHGTADKKASAQYYTVDRNTGEPRPAVHCHKCQKNLTTFWYLYTMERDWNDRKHFRDLYKFIFETFGIGPPLSVWFNYDADKYFADFSGGPPTADPLPFFHEAVRIRGLKTVDQALYLQSLEALLNSAATANGG